MSESEEPPGTSHNRGAGAVLFTPLATSGYSFPLIYRLTDPEERMLYDVEVRVRLGKEDAAISMMDLLTDFPAVALLERKTLLEATLDLLGGISFTYDESSAYGDGNV